MVVTLDQQHDVGEKPTVILYTYKWFSWHDRFVATCTAFFGSVLRIDCFNKKTKVTVLVSKEPSKPRVLCGEN